jgi:hypothetical protein
MVYFLLKIQLVVITPLPTSDLIGAAFPLSLAAGFELANSHAAQKERLSHAISLYFVTSEAVNKKMKANESLFY